MCENNLELKFTICESPPWRSTQDGLPSHEKMLHDIYTYATEKEIDCHDQALSDFVWRICQQEDIGIRDYRKVRQLVTDQSEGTFHEKETTQIIKAWKHLKSLLSEDHHKALLEVDECILKTHKILMRGISNSEMSTCDRVTTYKGVKHVYPRFHHKKDVESELWKIVDRYNEMMTVIKAMPNSVRRIGLFAKLEPEPDGNRLDKMVRWHESEEPSLPLSF